MNRALQWKLIAGFILVFIAGGMTGAFFAVSHSRHIFMEAHQPGVMSERMRERLRVELKLTPEQTAKLSPIIDKSTAELDQIRRETGRRVHETFLQAHREMAVYLTDEQRGNLQRLEARHRRWHGMHGPHPPAGEMPPP
jgi:Spy/CpxP family protein refolding chaperone